MVPRRKSMPWRLSPTIFGLFAAVVTSCAAPSAPPKPPSSTEPEPKESIDSLLGRQLAEGEPMRSDEVSSRGWLGIALARGEPASGGVAVTAVVPGSPAERTGIKTGDRI